jgi:hypothetical protein
MLGRSLSLVPPARLDEIYVSSASVISIGTTSLTYIVIQIGNKQENPERPALTIFVHKFRSVSVSFYK